MNTEKFAEAITNLDIDLNLDEPQPSRFSFKAFMQVPDLKHHLSIRGGYFFERVLKAIIHLLKDDGCVLVKKKFLGGSQVDLLFVNTKNSTVYYFEVRCNIDNDTEKAPATAKKIEEVQRYISRLPEYAGYNFVHGVLCPTNVSQGGIVYSKSFGTMVYSLEEFLQFANQSPSATELNSIVEAIRKLYKDQLTAI